MSGRPETMASPLVVIPASSAGNRDIGPAIVMPPAEAEAVVGIMVISVAATLRFLFRRKIALVGMEPAWSSLQILRRIRVESFTNAL